MVKRLISQILILSMVVPPGAFTANAAPAGTLEQQMQEIDSIYAGMNENISFLMRTGKSCSEYFEKSACPNAAAAEGVKVPASIFKQQSEENAAFRKRLAALKGAVDTLDSKEPTVENKGDTNSCKGAYDVVINEYSKRKTAAEQINRELAAMKKDLDENLKQLRMSGPRFHQSVARCAGEKWSSAEQTVLNTRPGAIAEFGMCPMICVRKEIPASAHRGMILLFKSETAACPVDTERKFIQLAGAQVDGPSQMTSLNQKLTAAQKDLPGLIANFGQKITENKALQARCGSTESAAKANPATKDAPKSTVNPDPKSEQKAGLAKGEKATPSTQAAGGEAPEVEAKAKEGEPKPKVVKTETIKASPSDQAAAATGNGDLTKPQSELPVVDNNKVTPAGAAAAGSVLPGAKDPLADKQAVLPPEVGSTASPRLGAEITTAPTEATAASAVPAASTTEPEVALSRDGDKLALGGKAKAVLPAEVANAPALPPPAPTPKDPPFWNGMDGPPPMTFDEPAPVAEDLGGKRLGDDWQGKRAQVLPPEAGGPVAAAPTTGPADDRTTEDLSGKARPPASQTVPTPPPRPQEFKNNDWGVEQPGSGPSTPQTPETPETPAPPQKAESSFPTGPVMLGVAALAAGGVAAGVILSRKKKSSSSGAIMPMPAPASTATATATATSVSTATSTTTNTATSTSSATATTTSTSGGGSYFPGTASATATNTSTSTATVSATSTSVYTYTNISQSTNTITSGSAIMPGSTYSGTQVIVPLPISQGK